MSLAYLTKEQLDTLDRALDRLIELGFEIVATGRRSGIPADEVREALIEVTSEEMTSDMQARLIANMLIRFAPDHE